MDNFLYISLADSVYNFKYVNSYIILVWYFLQPRTPTFSFNCCHPNFFYNLYSLPFIIFFVRFNKRFPSPLVSNSVADFILGVFRSVFPSTAEPGRIPKSQSAKQELPSRGHHDSKKMSSK